MTARALRIACVTPLLSHFEIPFFRLLDREDSLSLRVFHADHRPIGARVDSEYQTTIDWGEDLTAGYTSHRCENSSDIARQVKLWGPDAILVYGYSWPGSLPLLIANRLRRVPLVHRGPLNFHPDPRTKKLARLRRPLRKFVFRIFQAHHYSGGHSRRALEAAGVQPVDLFLVPYSVDTPFFLQQARSQKAAANRLRGELGFGPDREVALFIGQHNWFKGPDLFIEAVAQCQKTHANLCALIVGSGRMTGSLEDLARKTLRPGSYVFSGFVPSKETTPFYLASDVVLFTSRYETWARSVNEAMLCGRVPILNQIIPASDGLVRDGESGLVVPRPDPALYAAALDRFLHFSPERRLAMADAARDAAEEMSYERHIEAAVASILHAIRRSGRIAGTTERTQAYPR